jgi:hypothetical protein
MNLYTNASKLSPFHVANPLLEVVSMSELPILKEKLTTDPVFHKLFSQVASVDEAVRIAGKFGIALPAEDVASYQQELRALIGEHFFHLDLPRITHSIPAASGPDGFKAVGDGSTSFCGAFGGGCADG